MSKNKTKYICSNCGVTSAKWVGKCHSCNAWETFEEILPSLSKSNNSSSNIKPIKLSEIKTDSSSRILSNIGEFDRTLGGGIMPGSIVLIGGDPGIGKSTLMLQICENLLSSDPLYVSGEESTGQIASRAGRISGKLNSLQILPDTNLENIITNIESSKCGLSIIDSIQSIYSSEINSPPGSISQVRHCAYELTQIAKKTNIPIILIGHITKDGTIAGPKILEHIVDAVLQFEQGPNAQYRILRSVKNRFGPAGEIGVFEMSSAGLSQVSDPSSVFSSGTSREIGIAFSASMEGSRAMLIEVQALVSQTSFNYPQRQATGYDTKRMQMLLSVLEKRMGLKFQNQDVFLNITGGEFVSDPGIDLAVAAALVSSIKNKEIKNKQILLGEIGLTGEIRPTKFTQKRIEEAHRIGFDSVLIPKKDGEIADMFSGIEIKTLERISLLPHLLF
jgi:DNA repair protein RadA/Sms